MEKSTHYDLNLVQGSDLVNPLTVDRSNYETIDGQMYANEISAVQEATEIASSTGDNTKLHAINSFVEGATMYHFTATADFRTGDTFTFNGSIVTAYMPDGSGLTDYAYRINSEVLCSVKGSRLTVYTNAGAGTARDSLKLGGQPPEFYAKAVNAISVYTHSKVGRTSNFVGTGANGRVQFAANFEPGDLIQVNGVTVSAFIGAEDFLTTMAGVDLTGKWFTFVYDSNSGTLNFNGGGSAKVTVSGLIAANIVKNETVTVYKNGVPVASETGSAITLGDVVGVFSVNSGSPHETATISASGIVANKGSNLNELTYRMVLNAPFEGVIEYIGKFSVNPSKTGYVNLPAGTAITFEQNGNRQMASVVFITVG